MASLEERRKLALVARRQGDRLQRLSGGPPLFAVPVNTSAAAFESGVPQRLVLPPGTRHRQRGIAPDGQRFLIAVPQTQGTAPASIRVVLDWPRAAEEMTARRAPSLARSALVLEDVEARVPVRHVHEPVRRHVAIARERAAHDVRTRVEHLRRHGRIHDAISRGARASRMSNTRTPAS